jgi:hypothetical protein
MTTIVAPPSNASKWQMGFNSAFKGLTCFDVFIYVHSEISSDDAHNFIHPCIFGFLPDDDPQRAETRRRQYVT